MKLLKNNLTLLIATAISLSLSATISLAHHDDGRQRGDRVQGQFQSVTLNKDELRSLNQNGRIGLKRAIKNKLNNRVQINSNTKLVSVEVEGRATGGMSMISLKVDGQVVDRQHLNHRRRCHQRRNERRCRDRQTTPVVLHNSVKHSQGAWRLLADRDTRIRKVIITLKQKRPNHRRVRNVSLGTSKITKVIGRSKVFYANNQKVQKLTLKAKSNSLYIERVIVNYRNRSSQVIYSLEGRISEGRQKTVNLHNASDRVVSIEVDAVSDDIFGSSGRLEAIIGVIGSETSPRPRQRRHRH